VPPLYARFVLEDAALRYAPVLRCAPLVPDEQHCLLAAVRPPCWRNLVDEVRCVPASRRVRLVPDEQHYLLVAVQLPCWRHSVDEAHCVPASRRVPPERGEQRVLSRRGP
jgi:hypothetical protein